MRRHVKRSIVVALFVTGGVLFGACSSSDDPGSSDTAAESATQDVTDTSLDVQEQLDAAKQADDVAGTGNCAEAATAFGAVAMSASQAVTDPEAFSIDDLKKNIDIAREAVPAELEDEFNLYADMYLAFGQAIADAGGLEGLADPENAAKFADMQQKLDSVEVNEAGNRLTEYFSNECALLGS